ncbi:AbrB/MazE/SpoVT family DNA-binding domain-containing protein [Halorussus salilacus]|uniref:AbrB/MazE/SpoVT family DNA-binding domain-containing protein n=1 Tax=Halorussus salilacus TaxID=2953750 RepID=UPI0020A1CA49|nr:AbrB/MazE/SpoVT family DNA-binding domain-containing protein [Halorussus salilacus]USZ67028.1 AbrB/MazE/SpoVT family DNA-binding domain-containing protein [Halorussus salilacus]
MVVVDSKGRIVLPQDVRERLGLDAGTAVDVREEDGRAVVEPEERPEDIIEDLERRIEDATAEREPTPGDELDPDARNHVETIRRGASDARNDRGDATDE